MKPLILATIVIRSCAEDLAIREGDAEVGPVAPAALGHDPHTVGIDLFLGLKQHHTGNPRPNHFARFVSITPLEYNIDEVLPDVTGGSTLGIRNGLRYGGVAAGQHQQGSASKDFYSHSGESPKNRIVINPAYSYKHRGNNICNTQKNSI